MSNLRRVELIDGTYELFRHFFGAPPRTGDDGREIGAARAVVVSIVRMLAEGSTHLGVATDHVIESFRNELWPGYKTGEGTPPELRAQFEVLEIALSALGVALWPMVDLEADDALASAAAVLATDSSVGQIVICTPDKDLAQCVIGDRVVQLDRRSGKITNEAGVWEKFGVAPKSIPDWLALVGDSADGFPGLSGWGKVSASTMLAHYGTLDAIPDDVARWDPTLRSKVRGAAKLAQTLSQQREQADLFRTLATLRVDPSVVGDIRSLEWHGPTEEFVKVCRLFRDQPLADRVDALASRR